MDRFVPRDDGQLGRDDGKYLATAGNWVAISPKSPSLRGAQRRGSPWIASYLAMTGNWVALT
jgi:hypothetical protein